MENCALYNKLVSLAFIKLKTPEPAAKYLASLVSSHLAKDEKVLWLLPGGSSIAVAAAAIRLIDGPTQNLTISLTDERFGPQGHKDSNWYQLEGAGFDFKNARKLPVLLGKNLQATAKNYSDLLKEAFKNADYRLGFFGAGADAHIAGIKPGSPAISSPGFAEGYKWDDFIRLTMTPNAIRRLDEAVVYMKGEEKWPVIDKIGSGNDIDKEPVQILNDIAKVTIFNDHKGEPV